MQWFKEVEDHEEGDHWEFFKRSKMPSGAKTILSVWAFKRKRLPDGTISQIERSWWYAALGGGILGDIRSRSQLD